MRRIVNVIYKPHLATYKAYDEAKDRCCCVCDWKVIVEMEDGGLLTCSVIDEDCLSDFDLQSDVDKQLANNETDVYHRFRYAVGVTDVEEFIRAQIDEGSDSVFAAIKRVFSEIRESGQRCTREVEELMENIKL